MAGVGKTTILKKLDNELANQSYGKFDEVIWVVLSKGQNSVESIQDKIEKKLSFQVDKWRDSSQDENKQEIFRIFKMKIFVLLLDDIRKQINPPEVGIPLQYNQNKAKLVFTTRSKKMCRLMEAKIKAECLARQEAWDLLKIGGRRDPITEDVCKEYGGFQSVLVTIGLVPMENK